MTNLSLPTPDWSCGITDKTIYNGVLFKTGLYNELLKNDFIFADTDITFNADATSIKNYLKFDAMIYTSDYSNPLLSNSSTLTRQKIKATGSDTYDIGKCLDIKYVARYLSSNVTEIINTTSFKIDVDSTEAITNYDSRLFDNNLGGQLVCNIIDSTGNHNIRNFTISGDILTIDSPLISISLNDTFELISALDILKEGLEQTTGYPDKGYCIKVIKPDSNSYIKFGRFDVPPLALNSYIVVYYNQIAPYKPEHYFSEAIKRNGLYFSNEKIDFPVTKEQFDILLTEYYKFIESKKEYDLITYRPNEAQVGWKIPINIPYFPSGIYTITDVDIESIQPIGQLKDKHLIKQRVKLANYHDNLSSLLASFRNTSKLAQSRIAESKNQTSFINFKMISTIGLTNVASPIFNAFEFIDIDTLSINWLLYSSALALRIDLSLNSDFSTTLASPIIEVGASSSTSIEFTGSYIETSNTFYARIKVKTGIGISDWSDVLEINKLTLVEKIIYCEQAINGNYRLVKANPDNTSKIYLTPDSYTSLHPRVSHDGKKIVFTKEYSATKADLMLYDLETNTITNLTNFATNNNYVWNPSFNNDDTKILYAYHAGSRSATAVIKEMTIATLSSATLYTASGTTDNISPEYNTDNTKLYFSNTSGLVLFDIATSGITIIDAGNEYFATQHPTQNKIIYSSSVGGINYKLVERDLDINTVTEIYPAYSYNMFARYSPDGNSVIWASYETSTWQIKKKNLITNAIVNLTSGSVHNLYPEWANIVE